METSVNERKKSCPRCGVEFGCCTQNCWCSELPNIMPLVDNEDCLCYDCLKKEIDRLTPALSKGEGVKAISTKKSSPLERIIHSKFLF